MVEMSSMKITAHMDLHEVKKGLNEISQGMKTAQKDSKSTQGDFKRLELGLSVLGRTVVAVGGFFAGLIVEASKKAPALAGAMADINTSWASMIRSLGEGLAPVFDQLAIGMGKIADWASGHPDLFAGVVTTGAVASITLIAAKLLGISGASFAGATGFLSALGTLVLPAGLIAALTALGLVGAVAIGGGLAKSTLPSEAETLNVPIPEAAKNQIANAKNNLGTGEYYDLTNKYAFDPFGPNGGGASMTPEIDPTTGKLVDNKVMEDRIMRNAMIWIQSQNWTYSTRGMAMNSTDSYSTSGVGS